MEKLRTQTNKHREDLKMLAGEEAEKGGSSVKPYKNDIRFYL
jgi:hypothetical protein